MNCAWPFDYRAPAAREAYESVLAAVRACLGSDADLLQDQGVNHPDFYDLRTFSQSGREIGVSIKDKGALQQTYVFLRVQGLPQ